MRATMTSTDARGGERQNVLVALTMFKEDRHHPTDEAQVPADLRQGEDGARAGSERHMVEFQPDRSRVSRGVLDG